ncbi:MAG: helix-turn-helix domain-containing protein [Roseomonas sp.]|nr:helix-turn-helix domain-containing protein [Roseomonas sp.]MCA3330809.1 helix-turn-helix domain-containing protein [Roseomonas sp.]MCA3334298.1 helix-turn-helix domain-containing protein [Roseomonas sp.]MCA3354595.1 helix-turn-helix domain-containing protein [Roseomonas sp.]MCA3372782.1 helix-turn-helix domain-containing protein [Roseomonas sp.]
MKRSARTENTVQEAARVGEELREARIALGVSVEDAATQLRINKRYLLALEEGRVKDLPGAAYAVGFVRSYATALGLDADDAVRRFRDVSGSAVTKQGDLVFPEPVPRRGIPTGVLAALGLALAMGGYVAWYQWSGRGERVVDTVPPLPPRLERAAEATAPRETPATPAVEPPAPAPAPAAAPPAPPQRIDPDKPRIVIRAKGESWVQIRDNPGNRVLADRVLRAGETVEIPNRPGIVLTTGKAENLDILLDGQDVDPFGGPGVRRNIALEPERLRTPPTPPSPPAPATAPAPPPRPPAATTPPTPPTPPRP